MVAYTAGATLRPTSPYKYEVKANKVLIDVSHNSYYAAGGLSLLPQYLQAAGFGVEKRTTGTISRKALKPYCAYLIYLPQQGFSSAEKGGITDYVRHGGAVAVVGDWGQRVDTPAWWAPANDLGSTFGVPFAKKTARDPTNHDVYDFWIYFYSRNFAGSIMRPLSNVEAFATATLKPSVSGVQAIRTDRDASPANKPVVFTRTFGRGRVMILGDSNFWSDPHILAQQNGALAVRAVSWLCTGKASSGVAGSEEGEKWETLVIKLEEIGWTPPPGDTPWSLAR